MSAAQKIGAGMNPKLSDKAGEIKMTLKFILSSDKEQKTDLVSTSKEILENTFLERFLGDYTP